MANYDPKRGRPQAVIAEDTAVPIDEILSDPSVTPVETAVDATPESAPETAAIETDAQVVDLRLDAELPPLKVVVESSPVDVIDPPDRRVVRLIALGAAVATALAMLVAWRRSR